MRQQAKRTLKEELKVQSDDGRDREALVYPD